MYHLYGAWKTGPGNTLSRTISEAVRKGRKKAADQEGCPVNIPEILMDLQLIDYTVSDGYIFNGKYRYGELDEMSFIPEGNHFLLSLEF